MGDISPHSRSFEAPLPSIRPILPIHGDPNTFATSYSTPTTAAISAAITMTPQVSSLPGQPTSSDTTNSETSGYPSPPFNASFDLGGSSNDDDDDGIWDGLKNGTKAGVGMAITIGVLIIVAISVWYCCGCCGLRARRRKRRDGQRAPDTSTQHPVPLNTMSSGPAPPPQNDAPPTYEEVVPPQHQHIAGGARHIRNDEEEGVVADGKTPLSEIPFEDVVLDHSPSEGSSRSFGERHHGLGGDTRGHTNT
ncbi:hypothetical protein VTL71DRAFT_10623 [Oculimacula yallundae]|uniref:Uncharacterized protein n=1 Tax=Oculimacula yallundae TaxID=86028 RepID=A0ABR4CTJ0_9HELO